MFSRKFAHSRGADLSQRVTRRGCVCQPRASDYSGIIGTSSSARFGDWPISTLRPLYRPETMDAPVLDNTHDGIAAAPGAGVPTVGAVFFMTLLMAAASGLGALPFFFVRRLSPRLAALANALACGVMLAASFDLVHEGEPHGALLVVLGVCFGAVFIAVTQRLLRDQEDVKFGLLRGADARKTLLMVSIMTAHSLGEGSGVGVSFGGERGWTQGTLVTLAIGAHNIPEGMAVATVLAARGVSPWKCAGWAIVTSLPQPALAVPAFMFVETFASLLPLGMGFAAGCMIWITVAELLPDALEGAEATAVATAATVSAAALEAFRMWTAALERAEFGEASGLSGVRAVGSMSSLHDSITTGTYSTEGSQVEKPSKRVKFDPGGETLTTGTFVPTEKTTSGESASEALDRLARGHTERIAQEMRAAEFARATVGRVVDANGIAAPVDVNGINADALADSLGAAVGTKTDTNTLGVALATMAVPSLCIIAAVCLPKLLGDDDAAPNSPNNLSVMKSKRFRGSGKGKTGMFYPERAELLGAAAGVGAAVGFARIADAFRRCRFGDAPWLPCFFGAVVGVLMHLLLAEYVLGRVEAKQKIVSGKKDFVEQERGPFDSVEEGGGWNTGGNSDFKNPAQHWSFEGAHQVLLWVAVWASVSEGVGLSVASAAHGGHAAFPAAARVLPRACVLGWSGLAAGRSRWAACRAVVLGVLAEPVVLLIASGAGFGADGFVPSGWPSANAVALEAATSSALFAAATRTARNAAHRVEPRSANGGFILGSVVGCVMLAVLGALCWQTPYCDRSW